MDEGEGHDPPDITPLRRPRPMPSLLEVPDAAHQAGQQQYGPVRDLEEQSDPETLLETPEEDPNLVSA